MKFEVVNVIAGRALLHLTDESNARNLLSIEGPMACVDTFEMPVSSGHEQSVKLQRGDIIDANFDEQGTLIPHIILDGVDAGTIEYVLNPVTQHFLLQGKRFGYLTAEAMNFVYLFSGDLVKFRVHFLPNGIKERPKWTVKNLEKVDTISCRHAEVRQDTAPDTKTLEAKLPAGSDFDNSVA